MDDFGLSTSSSSTGGTAVPSSSRGGGGGPSSSSAAPASSYHHHDPLREFDEDTEMIPRSSSTQSLKQQHSVLDTPSQAQVPPPPPTPPVRDPEIPATRISALALQALRQPRASPITSKTPSSALSKPAPPPHHHHDPFVQSSSSTSTTSTSSTSQVQQPPISLPYTSSRSLNDGGPTSSPPGASFFPMLSSPGRPYQSRLLGLSTAPGPGAIYHGDTPAKEGPVDDDEEERQVGKGKRVTREREESKESIDSFASSSRWDQSEVTTPVNPRRRQEEEAEKEEEDELEDDYDPSSSVVPQEKQQRGGIFESSDVGEEEEEEEGEGDEDEGRLED